MQCVTSDPPYTTSWKIVSCLYKVSGVGAGAAEAALRPPPPRLLLLALLRVAAIPQQKHVRRGTGELLDAFIDLDPPWHHNDPHSTFQPACRFVLVGIHDRSVNHFLNVNRLHASFTASLDGVDHFHVGLFFPRFLIQVLDARHR